MNELSPTTEIEAPLASQRAIPDVTRPDVTRLPEQLISHPCDQLIAALTRAQEEIRAPMKNKTAHIRTRDGRQYQYSYATLDTVIDAVRLPLARNGIVETQLQNGDQLEVLLIHASGQWMRASMPLRMLDESQQAMASAITTARRIALQSMLGIAAEDDDDGSAGAGNEISNAGWQPRADGDEESPAIVRMARAARGIGDARDLIRSWTAHRPESERLRREDPVAWRRAADAVGTALDQILGGAIAACWRSAELAETRAHQRAVRDAMDGKWSDVLSRFRAAEPALHGDLMRHYNDRCTIIEMAAGQEPPGERSAERSGSRPAERLVEDAGEPPGEALSKRDLEVARQRPDKMFRHPLIDASGWSLINDDEEEDVWLSPDAWAQRFEALYRASGVDQRAALRDYNTEAIEDASRSLGAEVVFTDLFAMEADTVTSGTVTSGTAASGTVTSGAAERPREAPMAGQPGRYTGRPAGEVLGASIGTPATGFRGQGGAVMDSPRGSPMGNPAGNVLGNHAPGNHAPARPKPDRAVVPPRGMNGGVDKPAYLALLKASIAAHVHDAADATAWTAVNEPLYRSAGAVMGMEVLKALADHKRFLGIPLPDA